MLQRMNKSHRTETDWGLDKLHIHPKTILDIGCGGGAAIANLLQRYPDAQITGVDISETAIEESINLNREAVINDQIRIHLDNVENLSLGNEMFDLVVTINSYFFWSDFTKALKEIKRVLNKNGTVLLLGDAYKGYQLSEDVKQINQIYQLKLLSPEEMKSAFEKEGFKNIQVDTDNTNHWICVIAQK